VRYCFLVRHGERGDHSSDPAEVEAYAGHPDPILTALGHQQAIETGAYIKSEIERIQQLEGRTFDEIKVTCSPFLRTVSTCA